MTTIHNPADDLDSYEEVIGDYKVVGYLAYDGDCDNPLEDCEGMGYVVGRGKYQTRKYSESEMFEALGLDSDGEPDITNEAVLARAQPQYDAWVKSLEAADIQDLELGDKAIEFFDHLLNQQPHPNNSEDVLDYVWEALRDTLGWEGRKDHITYFDLDDIVSEWPPLSIDWDQAWEAARDAGEIGDLDAAVLDVYDHSGLHWSVAGGGMQCRWDTTHAAGVWLPDSEARVEILRRARVYDHAHISERVVRGKKYALRNRHGNTLAMSNDWSELWVRAQEIADLCEASGIPGTGRGRAIAAQELAEGALEQYNAWLSGDCYGVCVEVYKLEDEDDEDGELVEDEACWGFVGSDFAKQDLEEGFKAMVESVKQRVAQEQHATLVANRFHDAMANAL